MKASDIELDLLAPVGGGANVGYARVSTRKQNLARQLDALNAAGCIRIFEEKLSGKDADRPELKKCLDEYLRPGDTLTVHELSRLGRNLSDLVAIVNGLAKHKIGFTSLHERIDTTTPGGRLIFHVFAALAEFIRELIIQGTHEGLDAARARGVKLGRPKSMTQEQIDHAAALVGEKSVAAIARLLGVSRTTLYDNVPELKAKRTERELAAGITPTEDVVEIDLVEVEGADVEGQLGIMAPADPGRLHDWPLSETPTPSA